MWISPGSGSFGTPCSVYPHMSEDCWKRISRVMASRLGVLHALSLGGTLATVPNQLLICGVLSFSCIKFFSSSQALGNQSYFLKAFWESWWVRAHLKLAWVPEKSFISFPFLIVPVDIFLPENQWESLPLASEPLARCLFPVSSSFLLSALSLSLPFSSFVLLPSFLSFLPPSLLPPSSLPSLSQRKCYLLFF